jgi:septum formation protein
VLFLASQSPRRRQLLEQLGVEYSVLDVDIPEVPQANEDAEAYVRRVARDKAGAGFVQVAGTSRAVVLAADTEVVLDGRVYGKPRDAAEAAEMLASLAGRTHWVLSAVCCMDAGREHEVVSRSEVRFASLSTERIAAYVATGEPMGRAGAYAVQGRAAAFIEYLAGSYSGVMGLPLCETAQLLRRFGMVCP